MSGEGDGAEDWGGEGEEEGEEEGKGEGEEEEEEECTDVTSSNQLQITRAVLPPPPSPGQPPSADPTHVTRPHVSQAPSQDQLLPQSSTTHSHIGTKLLRAQRSTTHSDVGTKRGGTGVPGAGEVSAPAVSGAVGLATACPVLTADTVYCAGCKAHEQAHVLELITGGGGASGAGAGAGEAGEGFSDIESSNQPQTTYTQAVALPPGQPLPVVPGPPPHATHVTPTHVTPQPTQTISPNLSLNHTLWPGAVPAAGTGTGTASYAPGPGPGPGPAGRPVQVAHRADRDAQAPRPQATASWQVPCPCPI
eukprot:3939827-Rhodomonas_salina.3